MSRRIAIASDTALIKWRNSGVGSSDAPIVMKASPWSSPEKLLAIKTGQQLPDPPTFVMRRGIRKEPWMRMEYELRTGIPMPRDYFENEKYPFIRASYDGRNEDARRGLEMKYAGKVDHLEVLEHKRIPKKYVWQCVQLCFVSDLPVVDYWSCNPKFPPALVTFKRDRRLEKILIEQDTLFWNQVLKVRKELIMKSQPKTTYTSRELIDILKNGKEFMIAMKAVLELLQGFDLQNFATPTAPPAEPAAVVEEPEAPAPRPAPRDGWQFPVRRSTDGYRPRRQRRHACARCGSTALENWMTLCFNCYRAR